MALLEDKLLGDLALHVKPVESMTRSLWAEAFDRTLITAALAAWGFRSPKEYFSKSMYLDRNTFHRVGYTVHRVGDTFRRIPPTL